MQNTPKSLRLHIGIFGRRNVGKSSLLNAITRQQVSIVSEFAGTTTDPVEKPMELLPLGPVLFIDTAGIDDIGDVGNLRVAKTKKVFDRTDIGVIVTEADTWGEFEEEIFNTLSARKIPIVIVLNKIDSCKVNEKIVERFKNEGISVIKVSVKDKIGVLDFRVALLDSTPESYITTPAIVSDLVGKDNLTLFVIPVDKEAPKGRLILPEVQAIRDILDGDAMCMVVKETHIKQALAELNKPPKLVVTDSSCFDVTAPNVPNDIPLTSFSILFSRFKGDLMSQVIDTASIEKLKPGDKVLIAEACSHHPIADDIGRMKIPRLLNKYVGGELQYAETQGLDFPANLPDYKLVVHCGACMFNRRTMLNRILHCKKTKIPITNYGLIIAHCLGILSRALAPFPEIQALYNELVSNPAKRITSI
jgi:[FeFe] hydrogenase H-cluster maturation GTPase HydF